MKTFKLWMRFADGSEGTAVITGKTFDELEVEMRKEIKLRKAVGYVFRSVR